VLDACTGLLSGKAALGGPDDRPGGGVGAALLGTPSAGKPAISDGGIDTPIVTTLVSATAAPVVG
jgi:hypothetical protein